MTFNKKKTTWKFLLKMYCGSPSLLIYVQTKDLSGQRENYVLCEFLIPLQKEILHSYSFYRKSKSFLSRKFNQIIFNIFTRKIIAPNNRAMNFKENWNNFSLNPSALSSSHSRRQFRCKLNSIGVSYVLPYSFCMQTMMIQCRTLDFITIICSICNHYTFEDLKLRAKKLWSAWYFIFLWSISKPFQCNL